MKMFGIDPNVSLITIQGQETGPFESVSLRSAAADSKNKIAPIRGKLRHSRICRPRLNVIVEADRQLISYKVPVTPTLLIVLNISRLHLNIFLAFDESFGFP